VDEEQIRALLAAVRAGDCTDETFLDSLKSLPFQDLGFAKLDHHRHLRTGFPEVIFAQGKPSRNWWKSSRDCASVTRW